MTKPEQTAARGISSEGPAAPPGITEGIDADCDDLQADCGDLQARVDGLEIDLSVALWLLDEVKSDRDRLKAGLDAKTAQADSLEADLNFALQLLGEIDTDKDRVGAVKGTTKTCQSASLGTNAPAASTASPIGGTTQGTNERGPGTPHGS